MKIGQTQSLSRGKLTQRLPVRRELCPPRTSTLTIRVILEKEFNLSISLYTEAIALNPKDATFWNNRAMSKGKMEEHGGAISDASE